MFLLGCNRVVTALVRKAQPIQVEQLKRAVAARPHVARAPSKPVTHVDSGVVGMFLDRVTGSHGNTALTLWVAGTLFEAEESLLTPCSTPAVFQQVAFLLVVVADEHHAVVELLITAWCGGTRQKATLNNGRIHTGLEGNKNIFIVIRCAHQSWNAHK